MPETNPRVATLLDRALRLMLEALAQEAPDLHRLILRGKAAALFRNREAYLGCDAEVDRWFADHAEALPLSVRFFKVLYDSLPASAKSDEAHMPDLGECRR